MTLYWSNQELYPGLVKDCLLDENLHFQARVSTHKNLHGKGQSWRWEENRGMLPTRVFHFISCYDPYKYYEWDKQSILNRYYWLPA